MKDFLEDRIRVFLDELEQYTVRESILQDGFMYKTCGYEETGKIPVADGSFKEFKSNTDRWGGTADCHAWFLSGIEVKPNEHGEALLEVSSDAHRGWADVNPQFIAYVDGELRQGIDKNHRDIFLSEGHHDIALYGYTGSILVEPVDFSAVLKYTDKKVLKVYYDIKVPFEILEYEDEKSKVYTEIKKHLNNAVNLIDLRKPFSDEFYASLDAAEEYLQDEFYGKYCRDGEVHAICIGHTHIDVAWEWTLAQTREKVLRSFSTVLALMEKYPEYRFMSSQAQLYKYVKEESPELFEKIKERIREGRWEVEGGMWVEADCNLSSGESLVRQFIYGKRFMKEELGADSKVLWLPDVFGYSAALPQILNKCGIDKFVTSKIGWNESNKMPYDLFIWHGIDNTPVLTFFMTAQDKVKGKEPPANVTYNAKINASQLQGAYDRFQQKELYDNVLITFGHGDGGGGPTVKDLEYYQRLKKGIPGTSTAVMGFAGDFLRDIKEKTENREHMPHWFGELYLEFHRGTYTSQAKNKKYNRKSEFLLEKAESLSYMAESLEGLAYPKKELRNAWETVLLNQFHDIIPGSSIHEVYEVSHKQYEEVKACGEKAVNDSLTVLADNVSEDGILVYNNNSFKSSGAVKYKDGYIYAENIPAKGYKVIKPSLPEGIINITENSIESGTIRLTLDEKGNLCEIYDKRRRRQLLKKGQSGNVFRVYEDFPREYDNWEISSYYKEKHWDIDKVLSVEPVNEGERAGLRITKEYKDSKIIQTIYLYEHSDRIDFDTKIDWNESHLVLKTLFPVDINTNRAVYDIQFGFVERPTHHNTSWDAAKFEVCAHKYCDLSEYGYGVSLINDCKYGHSIYDGVMALTMLKCGTFPDPDADKGHHEFTYSLYPHAGDFREAGTIQRAYELNVPMDAIEANGQGSLPAEYSFISCNKENIFIETAKKAEAGDDLIIRAYEGFNMHTDARISFGFDAKKAYICDMLENNEREIEIKDNFIDLSFKPFEIITIRVEQ